MIHAKDLSSERTELRPALVGRETELTLLRNRTEDALHGRGAVVGVAGEAGAGKTRLIAEIESEATRRGMVCLRGEGDPARSGMAYGLFLGVLSGYLQVCSRREQSALYRMIEELAPHLRDVLLPKARRQVEPSADMNPELRQMLFIARLSRMLLEFARRCPTVLCLEDLHWTDSASLRLLQYLTTKCAEAPLLIVFSYRPEEEREVGREDITVNIGDMVLDLHRYVHFRSLTLGRLSSQEIADMIKSCFPQSEFGSGFLELICHKTEGIPLFVIQYLEFLRDKGTLYERQGLWFNRHVDEADGPESLHDVVRHRIAGLSDEDVEILSYAAVQGEVFTGGLVAQAMGRSRATVLRILSRLGRTTHLVHSDDRVFRFQHALLVDVFYHFLPESQRRKVHSLLASSLEQRQPEEVELLAYHFSQASSPIRALPYVVKAAERARAAFAYREAERFLNQALEAFEQLDIAETRRLKIDVLLAIADVDEKLGELNRSVERCEEVLRISMPAEDQLAIGQALVQLGWVRYRKGGWEEAIQLYRKALGVFVNMSDERACSVVYVRLGDVAFERSCLDEAIECFTAAKELATKSGNKELLGVLSGNLGVVYNVRGQYLEAVLNYTDALKAYRKINHRYGLCQIYHNLGMTHAAQKEWGEAIKCYMESERLSRDMGTVGMMANTLVSRALAQVGIGDLDHAEQSCRAAQAYMEQMGDRLGLAECKKVEGMIHRERVRYAEAEDLIRQGKYLFLDLENQLGVAECNLELGLVLQHRGDVEGARRYLRESSEIFRQIGAIKDAQKAEELLTALAS
ncbi:MAG: tetratricopeptide repeat protein [Candidatus Latescibacteria bacterium]|nr:tetratricopeptide repeat protein [Candidatus Latescibacterota bacterium]